MQAPIIVTFHAPADPAYAFKDFYERVRERGYILYPGKLTQVETFRVGCIGAIDANEMRNVVAAVAQTLKDMGIARVAPVESLRGRLTTHVVIRDPGPLGARFPMSRCRRRLSHGSRGSVRTLRSTVP